MSERDEQLRTVVSKLDAVDSDEAVASLTLEDIQYVRRQLVDGQNVAQDAMDRLRQVQEETEMISRRRDELEQRLTTVEADYEDLFGKRFIMDTYLTLFCVPAELNIPVSAYVRENHSRGRNEQHKCRGIYG